MIAAYALGSGLALLGAGLAFWGWFGSEEAYFMYAAVSGCSGLALIAFAFFRTRRNALKAVAIVLSSVLCFALAIGLLVSVVSSFLGREKSVSEPSKPSISAAQPTSPDPTPLPATPASAPAHAIDAPWRITKVDLAPVAPQSDGNWTMTLSSGGMPYLYVFLDFATPAGETVLKSFSLKDKEGQPLGTLYGWRGGTEAVVVYEGSWSQDADYFLTGMGYTARLPLKEGDSSEPVATAAAPPAMPTPSPEELALSESRPFALIAPQFLKTEGPNGVYVPVMRIVALAPDTFKNPGMKAAILIFDRDLATPPDDLTSLENSFSFTIDENTRLEWRVQSAKMNTGGRALSVTAASAFEKVGRHGVIRVRLSDLPTGRQLGLMVYSEDLKPLSNIVLFKESDFRAGDADVLIDSIIAELRGAQGAESDPTGPAATPGRATASALSPQDLETLSNLAQMADNAFKKDDIDGALEAWTKALSILQTVNGSPEYQAAQAATLWEIGRALINKTNRYEEGVQHAERALALYKAVHGSEGNQADCHQAIGAGLIKMERREEGIQRLEQALVIYKTVPGSSDRQAVCHSNISIALEKMGDYKESIQRFEEAVAIYRTIPGSERDVASAYADIGLRLLSMHKYAESLQRMEQALAIFETIPGAEYEQAVCLGNMGGPLAGMLKHEENIQRQEQALAILKTVQGAELQQALCHMRIAAALGSMGRMEERLRRLEEGLAILKTIPDAERHQASFGVSIANALGRLGRYEESVRMDEQSLAVLATFKGEEHMQAACYAGIGQSLAALRRHEEAISRYEEAHAIFKSLKGQERNRDGLRGCIGNVHLAAQRLSEAIAEYERAYPSDPALSGRMGIAYGRRQQPGDDEKAVKHFLEAARRAEEERALILASENRAGVFESSFQVFNDFAAFLADLDRRKGVPKEPALAQWTVNPQSESVALCAAFHYADQGKGRSLEDALREKATLRAARPDARLLAEDRELSQRLSKLATLREPLPESDERRKKLTEEIDSLQQRRNMIEVELKKTALGAYVAPDFRKPMEMARELEPDRAVLQYSVGEKEGWLFVLTRAGVAAHKLGAETPALPELFERQEASLEQLAEAWKARPDKVGLDGLVRLARARAEDLGNRESERKNLLSAEQEQVILARLGAAVLPDAALAELRAKGVGRLLVIPDGSMHYVPFAMLRLKGADGASAHYLVEEFATSYIPAMTTLDTIRKQKKERKANRAMERRPLLAFANPAYGDGTTPSTPAAAAAGDDMLTRLRSFRADNYMSAGLRLTSLPETEREAVRVASLFAPPETYNAPAAVEPEDRAVVFTGRGAAEETVRRLLAVSDDSRARRPWQYLLFSTHGLADTFNGMLSCLALATPSAGSEEDGFLQAQEVMSLELDADMVMLSACQTGLGRLRGGEGLVGLSAAFFYAGAESVCASLWQVPSGPTTQLAPEMFRRLKVGGVDRAEALRQAQLQVIRQGQRPDGKSADYSSPECWAAFVLIGEYR